MLLFAHAGITLGSAWFLQKATGRIKRSLPGLKTEPITTAMTSGSYTVETGPAPRSDGWLDYRFLLLGSLLPDIIDKPLGITFLGNGRTFCHTLLFTVLILAAGIYFFRYRKNPAIFCIALGCITHVLLDTMWANPRTFFWPLFGWGFQHQNISIGHWVQDMLNLLVTKPGDYIPEAIGAVSLGLFYFSLSRNGKISRLIKFRLRPIYLGLFGGRRQKHTPIGLISNEEAGSDLVMGSGLVKNTLE